MIKLSSARFFLHGLLSMLALQLLQAPAAAQDSARSPMSRSLEKPPLVEVMTASRISLRFQGQPDLTGDYRVGADATLSVPVIGRMDIAGMSVAQLEQELTRRVTEFTGSATYVTAEIAAYRPVFVTGFVTRPGAVEWIPGLTVLQAEALVGGIYRPPERANSEGDLGGVEALRSFRMGREQQKRLLASLARLKAEKAGGSRIEVPTALVDLVGEEEATFLIERQQSLMDNRLSGIEKKKAALARGTALAVEELEGLVDQSARVSEQLEMRRSQQENIAELLKKGLVPRDRSLESEIKIAELEEKATNVAVARARIEGTAALLRQDAVNLEEDRAAAIDAEIAKLESELTLAGIDVDAAMETYNRVSAGRARAAATPLPRWVINYTIVRRSETGEERATAGTSSYLRPGDVLLVSQEIEDEAIQPREQNSGDEAGGSASE